MPSNGNKIVGSILPQQWISDDFRAPGTLTYTYLRSTSTSPTFQTPSQPDPAKKSGVVPHLRKAGLVDVDTVAQTRRRDDLGGHVEPLHERTTDLHGGLSAWSLKQQMPKKNVRETLKID